MFDLDILEEREFCEWLATEIVEEDDYHILVDEIAHKLVDLGYLSVKDIAEMRLS